MCWDPMASATISVCNPTLTYGAVMSAHGQAGKWPLALWLLRGMTDRRLQPNSFTHNTAISACEKGACGPWRCGLLVRDRQAIPSGGQLCGVVHPHVCALEL